MQTREMIDIFGVGNYAHNNQAKKRESVLAREKIMRASLFAVTIAGAATFGLWASPSIAQEDADQKLGTVHFATSCNETAQRRFDRAMRYQHSFWYKASREIFEETLKADPTCGIAYWGMALGLLDNPHNPPPAPNLPLGLAAIQAAKATGAKSQRERDYIDALAVMYVDYDKTTHQARVQSYLKAMEALAAKHPDDDEAQIFYAITLNVAASPTDKTYANQLKGAAILEPIFKRHPRHPGVAHYLIHLYDTPALAERGIDAARRYAKIAPAAPHAQHMPSHIFTRVGLWKDSIASNLASVQAAKADKSAGDQMHGQDYLVYAYLQLGQDKNARVVIDDMTASTFGPDAFAAVFAAAASPARYMVERGDWKGAAELQVRPSKFPHVMAITYFARALGAARSGNPDAAKVDITKLTEIRDKLREAKDAYWSGQVDIQQQIATAWTLYAEGKYDDAIKAMSAAADAEDKTEKHPVTPGPLMPARELYGYMLLDRGMAKEALSSFEATMAKEPNRFNDYVGAAKAEQALGDKAKAKAIYEKLVALAGAGDRPVLAEAKAFVVSN
jgi:tetratricopeptide (TPR) repeat protein